MIEDPKEQQVCLRIGKWLPAYADGGLAPERAGMVEDHIIGCQSCRDEVAALRRVRSLLSGQGAGCSASTELSSKLISIVGNDSAKQPLWFSGRTDGSLPSSRERRSRWFRTGLGWGLAAGVLWISLIFLMAPDIRTVTDPAGSARADFAAWITGDGMNEAVAAVLLAEDRGAILTHVTALSDTVGWVVPTFPISREQARERLEAVRNRTSTVSGVQRVNVAADQGWVSARVKVIDDPKKGIVVTVFDEVGNEFMSGRVQRAEAQREDLFPAEMSYRASAPGAVAIPAGAAQLIEAVWDGAVVARWWVGTDADLLLWTERYSTQGDVQFSTGYERFETDLAGQEAVAERELAVFPAAREFTGDWCTGIPSCPQTLAGLPLVAYAGSGTADARGMRLVYSDGVVTATVTSQPGFLTPSGVPTTEFSRNGMPQVLAWQSGERVMMVATNGGHALLQELRQEFPAEEPTSPDLWWRIRAGFGRLVGLR